jgi:hypothetical protein
VSLLISVIKQELVAVYVESFAYLDSLNYLEAAEPVNASTANPAI